MARSSFKIEGLPGLKAGLIARAAALAAATKAAVETETRALANDARANAPRRTGELQGSIQGSTTGFSGEVRATARHAAYVEFGTSKAPAQAFMMPAADRARSRFVARVALATRKAAS